MTVECFAQRLLNPFRGVMHTVKYGAAEAVTVNGKQWDLYVANESLLPRFEAGQRTQVGDIRFGSWSKALGLQRGPLNPGDDFKRLQSQGQIVFEHLLRLHESIPFPFCDNFELWLLDADGKPLALLESTIDEAQMDLHSAPTWRAGYCARDHFESRVLQTLPVPLPNAGDYLTYYVNSLAGGVPAAQWFWRSENGDGMGLDGINLPRPFKGRSLSRQAFSPLFLATDGHDDLHQALIEEFHAWQTVWLLAWPLLDNVTRTKLERQARLQAHAVENHYRLYPELIDEGAIHAALVEGVMRQHVVTSKAKEEVLSVNYIELDPNVND
jgi:hypothetical protein